MKKEWSSAWKSSKQPRKQRKYILNAPSHVKQRKLGAHLSEELIKQRKTRTTVVRVGDEVRVLRGDFKGVSGKVEKVVKAKESVIVSSVSRRKIDGTKVKTLIHASKIMITKLNADDAKRFTK